jgi:hypothetical protein
MLENLFLFRDPGTKYLFLLFDLTGRPEPYLKKEITHLKNDRRNKIGCGQVLGVEIVIKVVGCDYNESTLGWGIPCVCVVSRRVNRGERGWGGGRSSKESFGNGFSLRHLNTINLTDDDPRPPPL